MDEFYNERFANKIVSLISKMDDDEAEMFMRFSTYDVLMADIEANRRTVDRRVAEVHKRLQDGVARAAASLVSKNAGVDLAEVAALVGLVSNSEVISKERTPYEELYGKPQPRGKGGRWSVSIARETYKGPKKGEERTGANRNSGDVMVGPRFNLTQSLDNTGQHTTAFAQEWTRDDPRHASTNYRTYQRLQAGSQALMHSNDPKVKAAGKVGQFFGQYGPEAEKVVGPHLRKTAYRYRGIERRPDTELIARANQASRDVMRHDGTEDLTPEQRTFASQRAATGYLLARLPEKKWSGLQQASGRIPPSEGVIINADGKIITQAVGHADDHYLPFNLKNLKGLQGGHYVRSRSQGGLTTEDIYTGLVSGARSVTVVSRSGVFTVNFSDDFRGGRRYNDKAAAMVGRYAKTLDAVKSETVDRRPLTLDERAEIRDEVEHEFEGDEYITRADIEQRIKEKETEYKSRPMPSKAELAEIDARARQGNEGDERAYKRERAEMISLLMDKKAQRNYQLDGEGYDAAMRALREQFPYYIESVNTKFRDASHGTQDDPFTGEKDRGYVKPKYIRPEGANEGYFDPTIHGDTGKGTGKVTADRTNYQNWAHNPERKRVEGAIRGAAGADNQETGAAKGVADKLAVQQKIARGKMNARGNESLQKLVNLYGSRVGLDDLKAHPMVQRAQGDGFQGVVDNPATREELMSQLNSLHNAMASEPKLSDVHSQGEVLLKAIRASKAGSHFDIDKAAESPSVPFEFDLEGGKKAAYSLIARDDEIEHEWERQRSKLPRELHGIQINQLDDDKLKQQAAAYGYMGHALKKPELDDGFAEWAAGHGVEEKAITTALNAAERGQGEKASKDYLKHAEALHRLRRLQWNINNNPNRQGEYKPKEKPVQQAAGAPQSAGALPSQRSGESMPGVDLSHSIKGFRAYAGLNTAGSNVARSIADEFQKLKNQVIDTKKAAHSVKWLLDNEDLEQEDYDRLKWMAKQYGVDPDTVTGEDPDA